MSKEHIFGPADILLPLPGTDIKRWAVLACDQFTSKPEYWQTTAEYVGDRPSTLNLILPEACLGDPDTEARIRRIHAMMDLYRDVVLTRHVNGFVYLRRTLKNRIRKGLIGVLDLEQYDYSPDSVTPIRATEATIPARIGPRLAVRRGASLELPHILVLVNDPGDTVIGPLEKMRNRLPLLYDTPLMQGGGYADGYAVTDPALVRNVLDAIDSFAEPTREDPHPVAIAIGDGNHSLATAKALWEEIKPALTEAERRDHPARFCLVELINFCDPAVQVKPIHRALFGCTADEVISSMRLYFDGIGEKLTDGTDGDQHFTVLSRDRGDEAFSIENSRDPICVCAIERFVQAFLARRPDVRVDYIHGNSSLRTLADQGAVGLLMPRFPRRELFASVSRNGTLPQKAFSMSGAVEKRYYLECRRIMP